MERRLWIKQHNILLSSVTNCLVTFEQWRSVLVSGYAHVSLWIYCFLISSLDAHFMTFLLWKVLHLYKRSSWESCVLFTALHVLRGGQLSEFMATCMVIMKVVCDEQTLNRRESLLTWAVLGTDLNTWKMANYISLTELDFYLRSFSN